ncbi:hypothetical protein EGI32_14365 [Ferruginibacter sp. HRS2-29]|nr:hypothetical protein [Ferruginibacter sp. HRS2-29]
MLVTEAKNKLNILMEKGRRLNNNLPGRREDIYSGFSSRLPGKLFIAITFLVKSHTGHPRKKKGKNSSKYISTIMYD